MLGCEVDEYKFSLHTVETNLYVNSVHHIINPATLRYKCTVSKNLDAVRILSMKELSL
jgi:hypothetical protein